jgi:hypothetical protein
VIEHNWNFLGPGQPKYRPYHFYLDTDFQGGYGNPLGSWWFKTDKQTVALHINQNGNVKIGGDTAPQHRLEVLGSISATEDLHLGSDRSVLFDGNTAVEDDSTGGRLVLGSGYDALVVGADDVKLADQAEQGGASLVLGSCDDTLASTHTAIGNCNVITFTGGAEIRSVDGCDPGKRGRTLFVTCGSDPTRLCDGDGVRCSGGNLRLSGADTDFTCSPDDALLLICDGVNWRQVASSLN